MWKRSWHIHIQKVDVWKVSATSVWRKLRWSDTANASQRVTLFWRLHIFIRLFWFLLELKILHFSSIFDWNFISVLGEFTSWKQSCLSIKNSFRVLWNRRIAMNGFKGTDHWHLDPEMGSFSIYFISRNKNGDEVITNFSFLHLLVGYYVIHLS